MDLTFPERVGELDGLTKEESLELLDLVMNLHEFLLERRLGTCEALFDLESRAGDAVNFYSAIEGRRL